MLQALLHNKLKYSFQDPHFTPSEDSLTSSVIGLMQYLPDALFWQFLRDSCGKPLTELPKDIGEILSVNFWEKMSADGIMNSNYVEPDVWIECEKYDIIIEAKKYDSWGQYEEQWQKEIISYNKTFENNDRELIFIALGGNVLLKDCPLYMDGKEYIIYKSRWYNLLSEVDRYLQGVLFENITQEISENETKEIRGRVRLLKDIISIFAKHGHLKMKWLGSINKTDINKNSRKKISTLWKFDNKAILQDFYKPMKPITINNINDVWK